MKKVIVSVISIIILAALCFLGYGKYKDYKINKEIENVKNMENNKEANMEDMYRSLLSKYNNDSRIYLSLSDYYIKILGGDKAIQTLYEGIEHNGKDKLLVDALAKDIKDADLQDGYLRVTKGSTLNKEDKISLKTKSGQTVSIKTDFDTTKIDTSKEGYIKVGGKEEYTGIDVNLDIEVVEFTGNTMANNLTGGKMAYKDGWIYFQDPTSKGLYKMKEDLSEKTSLDENVEPSYINIKDNNIYFIDSKSGQYGSLVKTDLEGKNKQVIRQNTGYAYIVGDNIYYTETKGEHNGWRITSLNKMNFNYEDVEKDIAANSGSIEVINNKYFYLGGKNGGFIQSQGKYRWGEASNPKYLGAAEIYKGEIYGDTSFIMEDKKSFGKLNIDNNTQSTIIDKVERFNSIGKDVYYINEDGIFVASIDGNNQIKLMDIEEEPLEISLYNINNKMYSYSEEIKIVKKEEKPEAVNVPDIKNEDIISLCNSANKLLLNIQDKRSSEQLHENNDFYSVMEEPYTSKEKIKSALSMYFTKAYAEKFVGGKTFIEKDGKLYLMIGDSGLNAFYNYTSIKSRQNKGNVIKAVSYAEIEKEPAQDGEIKLKLEDGKWKIDSFHSAFQ